MRVIIIILLSVCLFSCSNKDRVGDVTQYVDPLYPRDVSLNVIAGGQVPFGSIITVPNYVSDARYILSSFSFLLNTENGIKQSGLYISPTITGSAVSLSFAPANETAGCGYYSIETTNGICSQISATEHCAMHYYHYPNDNKHIMVMTLPENSGIYVDSGRRIHGNNQDLYWIIDFSMDCDISIEEDYVVLNFEQKNDQLLLKVSISEHSHDEALSFISKELSHWSFDKVKHDAHRKWKRCLSTISVEGKDDNLKRLFYTGLYAFCSDLYRAKREFPLNRLLYGKSHIYNDSLWTTPQRNSVLNYIGIDINNHFSIKLGTPLFDAVSIKTGPERFFKILPGDSDVAHLNGKEMNNNSIDFEDFIEGGTYRFPVKN